MGLCIAGCKFIAERKHLSLYTYRILSYIPDILFSWLKSIILSRAAIVVSAPVAAELRKLGSWVRIPICTRMNFVSLFPLF
jgi:hypothetical protein